MPIHYFQFIFSCILPFIYLLTFYFLIRLYYYIKKIKFSHYIMITAGLFIFFYIQTDLASLMVQLVSCRSIGLKRYVVGNVAYECNQEFYKYGVVLILPSIVVFLVGIPLVFVIILYRNRLRLKNENIVLKYGYLLKEYKQETYYWEFVKMMQRMLIIFVINFYS